MHFALIGAVLFCVDMALRPEKADPRLIRVDDAVHRDLAKTFEQGRDRLPTADEMDEMVDLYVKNETLYREARALQLDHGDQMMRERLMQRMRLLLYEGITVADPPQAELRAWFEERAEQYVKPALVSFRVIGLDGEKAEAEAIARDMNAARAAGVKRQPTGHPLVHFLDRPRRQITEILSEDFVASIEVLAPEVWTPLPSPQGWQVAQFVGSEPEKRQSFEEVAEIVLADWREHELQRQARAALEALMANYPIERDPYGADVVRPADDATAAQLEGGEAAVQ